MSSCKPVDGSRAGDTVSKRKVADREQVEGESSQFKNNYLAEM